MTIKSIGKTLIKTKKQLLRFNNALPDVVKLNGPIKIGNLIRGKNRLFYIGRGGKGIVPKMSIIIARPNCIPSIIAVGINPVKLINISFMSGSKIPISIGVVKIRASNVRARYNVNIMPKGIIVRERGKLNKNNTTVKDMRKGYHK